MATLPFIEKLTGGWNEPDRAVVLVPGHNCFGVSAALPPGTLESEQSAVAALALEQVSPFPIEHLATGHVANTVGDGLVASAVYRRKLPAEELESWKDAHAVIPDYSAFLCGCDATGVVVILETAVSVTGLDFGASRGLPQKIVSRAIPAGGTADQARETVLSRLSPGSRTVHRYRLGDVPVLQRGARLRFNWVSLGNAPAVVCEMSDRAVWAQDLRDAEESRTRRKTASVERGVVRIGAGLLLLLLLLLVGEGLLLLGGMWVGGREDALDATAGGVQQIESDFEVSNRLDAYGAAKPVPLELLAYINDLRPRSIYFTRTSFDAPAQMTVDAATANVADVNEYEAALRRAGGLALVETRNLKAREGGATFQLILAFRPGFAPSAGPAPGAASPAPPSDIPVEP